MSSNVVKCTQCNIVINEVLAFICNKCDVMDEESICRICSSAFSNEDIVTAKKLLFESVPSDTKIKKRKGSGKVQRNIEDIVCFLKSCDPTKTSIPVFVARDLEKLPPVLFDHVDVTRLLKDVVKVQSEISQIKEEYATFASVEDLKRDLESLKKASIVNYFECNDNVNKKRGVSKYNLESYECNSGPMGIVFSHDNNEQVPLNSSINTSLNSNLNHSSIPKTLSVNQLASHFESLPVSSSNSSSYRKDKQNSQKSPNHNAELRCKDRVVEVNNKNDSTERAQAMTHQSQLAGSMPTAPPLPVVSALHVVPVQELAPPSRGGHSGQGAPTVGSASAVAPALPVVHTAPIHTAYSSKSAPIQKSFADTAANGEWKKQKPSEEWTKVQRQKLRNRFVGKRGSAVDQSSNFKAAEVKTPIYIYNVSKEVSVCDIVSYIKNKTSINAVVEKNSMKRSKDYDAYKVLIPKHKEEIFLKENFWPDGIAFRPYVDFRRKATGTPRNSGINN
ncbi:hypothetical protein O0L34_g1496 [Tuta absoluta]|nr:hypothetical protein O0L34_g1496 [Tuta absoluta]